MKNTYLDLEHLQPPLNLEILNVGTATPAVSLNRVGQIYPKSGRKFCEVILAQTLGTLFSQIRDRIRAEPFALRQTQDERPLR